MGEIAVTIMRPNDNELRARLCELWNVARHMLRCPKIMLPRQRNGTNEAGTKQRRRRRWLKATRMNEEKDEMEKEKHA